MKKIIILIAMIVLSTIATQKTFAQDLLNGAVPSGGIYTTEMLQTDSTSIPFICDQYDPAKSNFKEKGLIKKSVAATNKDYGYDWQGDFWGGTVACFLMMFILMLYIISRRKK